MIHLSRRSLAIVAALAMSVMSAVPVPVAAQEQVLASASRRPKFLLTRRDNEAPAEIDPRQVAILRQRISVNFRGVPLVEAVAEIARQARLSLMYTKETLPRNVRVQLRADHITVAGALAEVLIDADVDVLVSMDGRAALVRRGVPASVPRQVGTIIGQIVDSATRQPVSAAEILLDGTSWRARTDSAGRYRLVEIETGTYTLTARRLGYAKRSRRVTVREGQVDTVDLALAAVAAKLDELVSTATGRRRRLDVPNDITVINADSVMRDAPIRSVTDLLANRVPGLTVQRTSGAPGDPARLRLRGAGSPLQNNDPIVVVDGVRQYAKQSDSRSANLASGAYAATFAAPSPLDYIDPNSIETIEVVKGPSATTLYGPDAANGVVVITTKKGRAGPTRWTMNAAHTRTQLAGRYPDLLFRQGHVEYTHTPTYCPLIPEVPCAADSTLSYQMLNDPTTTILDKGHRTDLSVGVSGGVQALTYDLTGSYADELGLVKLPDYEVARYQTIEGLSPPDWMRRPQWLKQWGVTSNITARLGPAADVTLSTTLSRTRQQRSTLEMNLGDLMATFLDRGTGRYITSSAVYAPFSQLSIPSYRTRVTDAATLFRNSLSANWHARPWLTATATAGLDVQQRADELLVPRSRDSLYYERGANNNSTGDLNLGTGTVLTSTVRVGALALAPLGRGFQFRFASGVDYVGTSQNDVKVVGSVPYGSSQLASVQSSSRDLVDDATFGWYLAPSVGNQKFNLDLGLRLDGGKAYGSNVNGFHLPKFPKLGFSYLLSDEPFFPFKDLFQSFRVRASYGRAGRQPGPAERLRLYSNAQSVSGIGDYVTLSNLGNTELRPERTAEFEGGVDADLLDSRLSIILTGYRKTTTDAIVAMPLPPSVYGLNSAIQRNIGVICNTGLELSADAQLVRSSALTWSTHFFLTHNRNMVVRLGPGVLPFYTDVSLANTNGTVGAGGTGGIVVDYGTRVAAGYPLFSRWARPVLGYADANDDGVLEAGEILRGDTAVYVGPQEPDYTLTVAPSVSLGHGALTLTAGLVHVGGVSQMNEVASKLAPFTRGSNDPTASLAEQLATGQVAAATVAATRVQTVATTRLDYLSVRYTIPAQMARRLGAQQLNIAVQGSNLRLWTNYRGLDPDVNAFATGNSVTDTGILPQSRSWRVQFNATY